MPWILPKVPSWVAKDAPFNNLLGLSSFSLFIVKYGKLNFENNPR